MSLLTFFADLRGVRYELRRIADVLERYSPTPYAGPVVPIQPEDISYSTDEATALVELHEQAKRLGILEDEEADVQPENS